MCIGVRASISFVRPSIFSLFLPLWSVSPSSGSFSFHRSLCKWTRHFSFAFSAVAIEWFVVNNGPNSLLTQSLPFSFVFLFFICRNFSFFNCLAQTLQMKSKRKFSVPACAFPSLLSPICSFISFVQLWNFWKKTIQQTKPTNGMKSVLCFCFCQFDLESPFIQHTNSNCKKIVYVRLFFIIFFYFHSFFLTQKHNNSSSSNNNNNNYVINDVDSDQLDKQKLNKIASDF